MTGARSGRARSRTASDIDWSASTVRAELASLEEEGLLTHPAHLGRARPYRHRLPLLRGAAAGPAGSPAAAGRRRARHLAMRREVDVAIRETTTTLSQITDLVALVTAPPLHTATIHRIEVLRLQPKVVMVVVIASNGGVTKRVFTFDAEVDPGLVEWAASYLNERLAGLGLGARMAADRLRDPELGPTGDGVPRRDLERLHRPRGVGRGHPLRGRDRAAALRGAPRRPAARRRPDARRSSAG